MCKKSIAFYKRVFSICLACLYLLLVNGCNDPTEDFHQLFFDSLMKKIDDADVTHKQEAIAFLDSAFYAFPNPSDLDKIMYLNSKGEYYLRTKKDYGKAMLYTDSTLMICERRINEQAFVIKKASALYIKGVIYFELQRYDECLRYYVLSKRLSEEKIKDRCNYVASASIADLLFRQGNYRKAAAQYLENFATEEKCQEDKWIRFANMQRYLNNVGMCYSKEGIMDSASFYFDSALQFITTKEQLFPQGEGYISLAKAVVFRGQAGVLERKGQPSEAENLYLKSIEGTKNNYVDFTTESKIDLVTLYIENNELQKATLLLHSLEQDSIRDESTILKFYKLLVIYYKKINNNKRALEYAQRFSGLRDSIDTHARRLITMDVGREFENREQKAINELLVSENKAKSFQLAAALLLSALAIAVILFVWYNLRRSARHVNDLEKLNLEIIHQKDDLQKAFTSLEQSQEENTKITRMVAHDLKNPISGIRTLAFTMIKKEESEELRESLELIYNACNNSVALINDLLSESKSPKTINKEMVDMRRLLEYCVELLRTKAAEKKQELHLDAQEPVTIMVNRQKMWRVISNILTNAIKFSREHAIIHVKLEKKEQTVLLSIEDNGIGIPEALKDKVLQLDPEASRIGTAGEESHGLGLSISSNIVAEHNGKLWFESEEGQGCTFYVELPCAN